MSQRIVYHVLPNGNGWRVVREGADRAVSRHDNKEEAVERGRELAKANPLGQLIVHKQDGTIETEYTYGKDPYPPAG